MNENMGSIIMRLRKEHGMTQEQLASALGITFQAVSKWENGVSSPDISALPLLADLFQISVDELFGRAPLAALPPIEPEESANARTDLPWPDDDTFYAVLYHGQELIGELAGDPQLEAAAKHFVFQYEGPVQNIRSAFSVEVDGDVSGSVEAGENVSCESVKGDVLAGVSVNCGDVEGSVSAGADVDCGDVEGDVISGGSTNCGDVNGRVQANGNVSSGDVGNGLEAGGSVDCGDVAGAVNAGAGVSCGDVGGDVNAGAGVDCNHVGGSVHAGTKVRFDGVNGTAGFGGDKAKEKREHHHVSEDDFDRALDEMIDRQVEDSIRLSLVSEDDFDRALDEMIDRQVEDSIRLSLNLSDLGENLGKTISDAVQRAVDFGSRFGKKKLRNQDETEEQ